MPKTKHGTWVFSIFGESTVGFILVRIPLNVFSKWLKYLQSIWHSYFCQLLKIDPSIWFSIGCSAFLLLFTHTAVHDSMNFMIPAVHTSWTDGNHACCKGFARVVLWTRHTSLKEQIAVSDIFNYTQTLSYICSSERSSLTAKYGTALNHFHMVFYHLNIVTCVWRGQQPGSTDE